MSSKPSYFKLGLFTLVAIALAVAALLTFGAGHFFQREVLAETYLDESVQGLEVGGAVRYRGVKVGRIREISFVHNFYDVSHGSPSSARHVLVRFTIFPEKFRGTIDKPFDSMLKDEIEQRGLRAKLGTQGITGVLYIEIDYIDDPSEEPPIEVTWRTDPNIYYIPSTQSLITRMSDSMREITDKVSLLLAKIDKIPLEQPLEDLRDLMQNLSKEISDAKIGVLHKKFDEALKSVEDAGDSFQALVKKPEVEAILEDVAAAAQNTKGLTGDARKAVGGTEEKLNALLTDLQSAAKDFKAASAKVRELAEQPQLQESTERMGVLMKRLDRLVAGQESQIEQILGNVEQITRDLRAVSRETRENPSQVIFGSPPRRPENEEK
ncbi:MAG: MlaD family protein [Candidatus Sumerlaeota bacterium]